MARKLAGMLIALALVAPAGAAGKPGVVSGYVRNSAGVPQMGAVVELLNAAVGQVFTVFTDERGYYSATDLSAGLYHIKVSAPSFLPSVKDNLLVRSGTHLAVNLTLTTLSDAMQMLPARRRDSAQDDAWRWTLRSASDRPILRVFNGAPQTVSNSDDRGLKAQVALVGGSDADGFGGAADMTTNFRVEQSVFSAGTLAFNGNVGYGSGEPAGVFRASYSHKFSNGSHPQFAITVRRFASPDSVQHNGALAAAAFSVSDGITLADVVELNYGGEAQMIQFGGRESVFRPFGSLAVHLAPHTLLQYRYATSEPNTRMEKGFDSAPADLSESGPRMSMSGGAPVVERSQHHEISLSQRIGKNDFQVAVYSDRVRDAALVGVGDVTGDSGVFLPDIYSGTFSYNGGELSSRGLRVVAERKIASDLYATVDYAFGGVINLDSSNLAWDEVQGSLHTAKRHSVAAKVAGDLPRSKTHWIASYKWTSGPALTAVDMFNVSPGEADPYVNLFIRQPLPATSFLPGRLEALVDLRNLLAQGYIPVLSQDGQTVYLVQSARSVRGGLSFTF